MRAIPRFFLRPYGIAVLATGLALLLRGALWPVLGNAFPFVTFLPAIMVASYYGGLRAGLATTVLSALAGDYFLLESPYILALSSGREAGRVAAFVIVGTILSGFSGALHSARRRAEAAEARMRVTLASIGDGVLVTDLEGRVTFLNEVAQALTGWLRTAAVGQTLERVFPLLDEQTRQPVADPVAHVRSEGTVVGLGKPTLLRTRDGQEVPIDDSAAPIRDADGNMVGVVLVFRDASARRRAEREREQLLDKLAEELAHGAALAEDNARLLRATLEASRQKDEFLALLGHELRNPLAPIRTALQVLRLKGTSEPVVEEMGTLMERQVGTLVRLVDDLLDVARITRGKIELRKEPVDLAAVVTRAVEMVRHALDERGHRLEVTLPPGPQQLLADPARLSQVLANLLANASKYTPAGGRIGLTAAREGDEAVVRVQDNGIGIRPENLSRIFELFIQGDRVTGSVREGLGIGLHLVRRLVELHGGRVAAFSDGLDRGSEFVVRLPLRTGDERAAASQPAPVPQARESPLRVLIVDDNHDAAETCAMLLRLHGGHEVRVAHDGPSALAAAAEFLPEVVLLDIALPGGMDGYEVCRRLRQLDPFRDVPIGALTGYGQEKDRQLAREAGFTMHLVKPVEWSALAELLARTRRCESLALAPGHACTPC
jgi:PAS domain S-box-containing protein